MGTPSLRDDPSAGSGRTGNELVELLQRTIKPEPSSVLREGGVIADGFDPELDELRGIQTNCGDFLLALESRERARTGITTLKVEYNRVHGFYIEVSAAQSVNVPDDYRRRQTLKNAERYITPELKAFEDKALSANERALARENFLYEQLLDQLAPFIPQLQRIAAAIAELDVLATFAERAATLNFSAPQFCDDAQISIKQRPPSGGGSASGHLHAQRHHAQRRAPHAADHRPQHGRQIHLHAPGRASSRCSRMSAASSRRKLRCWARSTRSSRASAHRTTSPADAPPSWSR